MRKLDVEKAIDTLRRAYPAEFAILAAADAEVTEWRVAYAREVLAKVATAIGTPVGPRFAQHAMAAIKRLDGRDNAVFWRDK